jgi:hypothetical protein
MGIRVAQAVRRHASPVRRRRSTVVGCFVLVASGCLSQGAKPDESETQVRQSSQALSTAMHPSHVSAPLAANVIVRRAGSDYEIEVRSPGGFSPHALDPVLYIGAAEFRKYRMSSEVGEYGAVFMVPAAEFDALADGSAITIGYGSATRSAHSYGSLNKNAVVP